MKGAAPVDVTITVAGRPVFAVYLGGRHTLLRVDGRIAQSVTVNRKTKQAIIATLVDGRAVVDVVDDAGAQPLTKDQQKCVRSLNKGMTKVDAAVAKQIAGCLKNHASGKPLSKSDPTLVTLEGCAVADEKGKINKATQKTIADFQKACVVLDKGGVSRFPPYAATDASTVNGAATTKEVELSHDIFGADLDSGVLLTASTDKAGAKCQQGVWKAATKCQSTRLKEFTACAKEALKSASGESAEELENQC